MKYIVEYQTDFCDAFSEKTGSFEVVADNETQAFEKAKDKTPYHSVIVEITKAK